MKFIRYLYVESFTLKTPLDKFDNLRKLEVKESLYNFGARSLKYRYSGC